MSGFFYCLPMNLKKISIFLLLALSGLVLFLLFLRQGDAQEETPEASSSQQAHDTEAHAKQEKKRTVIPSASTGGKTQPLKPTVSKQPAGTKEAKSVAATTPQKPDPETALKRWEDRLVLYYAEGAKERVKDTPVTVEEQVEMREFFNALASDAKLENINHAVNLLPDETVSVLNGILLDTAQPAEVLGVIFHDMLNRDEAIKNPLMEEIVKNKAHPMYVESARILDIVK